MSSAGTKLALISPQASRSAIHIASLMSVLRPGTCLMGAALARISSKGPSLRMFQTGLQYTSVASIATCLTRLSVNHASNANRPPVVVAKVRHSHVGLRPTINRTQATTVSLWTSRPAPRLCMISMASPPHLHRRGGGLQQHEI